MILLSRSIKILYDWNRAFCKKIRRIVLQRKRFRITQNRLKLKSQCWKAEEFSLLSPVFGNVSRDFFDGKSIRLIPLDNRFHDIRSKIVQRKNS